MKYFVAVISVVALFMVAGCGSSSSSSGGNSCATIGDRVASCTGYAGAGDVAEAQCNAYTCTGDRQTAIDCVLSLPCSELETGYTVCTGDQDCVINGATCSDVVMFVNGCISELGGSSSYYITYDDCNAVTCTDKQSALNCVVGLDCNSNIQYNAAICALHCDYQF